MIAVQGSVFSEGLVEIAILEIEITEHGVALGLVRDIFLGLLEECLRLVALAFLHQKTNHGGAGSRVLGIDFNGVTVLLLSVRQAIVGLVEATKRELCVHGF